MLLCPLNLIITSRFESSRSSKNFYFSSNSFVLYFINILRNKNINIYVHINI